MINPRLQKKLAVTDLVAFVPMSNLSAERAEVILEQVRPYGEVAKGYTPFLDGDVLVAKITPCFENNKIGQARLSREVAFGSTEFHVIRPNAGKADARYLMHYLRQAHVRAEGERKMTGSAGQRRVPEHFLANLDIPLPPLPEQCRIAAILDQADALRAKRRAAMAGLDEMAQAIFVEMFGTLELANSPWPLRSLEELAADTRIGLVRASKETGSQHPHLYLKMDAIGVKGDLDLAKATRVSATLKDVETYSLKKNDFVFNTRNSRELVGKSALFRSRAQYLFNNNIMRIRFNKDVEPEYILAAMRMSSLKERLENKKSGTTNVFAIYWKDLKTLQIPLPPLSLQSTFVERLIELQKLTKGMRSSIDTLGLLFASLQHRAFTGAL